MSDTYFQSQDLLSVSCNKKTLLLIEDDSINASLVAELIARRDDIKLVTAGSGYQGLVMARSHHPDLIMTDIRLYDRNGFDVLKALKEDPITTHIPVIGVSSNAYSTDIEKALKAGFFRYLTKPYKIVELMAAIDNAFKHIELMLQAQSS